MERGRSLIVRPHERGRLLWHIAASVAYVAFCVRLVSLRAGHSRMSTASFIRGRAEECRKRPEKWLPYREPP